MRNLGFYILCILPLVSGSAAMADSTSVCEKVTKSKKTSCIEGDFNNDGTADYATAPLIENSHWKLTIHLTSPNKEPESITIPQNLYNAPVIFPKGTREFDCPVSDVDGIIEYGEGGDSHVFLWDKKKAQVAVYTCASEDN